MISVILFDKDEGASSEVGEGMMCRVECQLAEIKRLGWTKKQIDGGT